MKGKLPTTETVEFHFHQTTREKKGWWWCTLVGSVDMCFIIPFPCSDSLGVRILYMVSHPSVGMVVRGDEAGGVAPQQFVKSLRSSRSADNFNPNIVSIPASFEY